MKKRCEIGTKHGMLNNKQQFILQYKIMWLYSDLFVQRRLKHILGQFTEGDTSIYYCIEN